MLEIVTSLIHSLLNANEARSLYVDILLVSYILYEYMQCSLPVQVNGTVILYPVQGLFGCRMVQIMSDSSLPDIN